MFHLYEGRGKLSIMWNVTIILQQIPSFPNLIYCL